MGDGTTVEVFGKNVHRTNAKYVLEEAANNKDSVKKELIAAVAKGSGRNPASIVTYVDELLEWYEVSTFKELIADRIIEDPENCVDDYDSLEDAKSE